MSYVWHLSQSWRPEWGGALYWAQNDHAVATYPITLAPALTLTLTLTTDPDPDH